MRGLAVALLLLGALTGCAGDEWSHCDRSAGQPSWIAGLVGHGATAREAVSHTLWSMSTDGRVYAARQIGRGDEDADLQTWLARRQSGSGGLAGFTIRVERGDAGFVAGPSEACD